MRPIDADALRQHAREGNFGTMGLLMAVPLGYILDAPTVERPTGHWEYKTSRDMLKVSWHQCSLCGAHGSRHFRFCPNCGAKMEANHE